MGSSPIQAETHRRVPLGTLATVTAGGTPSRKRPEYWNGDVPWVTTGQLDFGIITGAAEHITELGLRNSSAKLYPAGTLVMAMFGQGVTRGKVGILGIEAAFNQACVAIVPKDGHSTRYLYHHLAHDYRRIRQLGQVGTQSNLNSEIIKGLPILLLSPGEQAQIARVGDLWDRAAELIRLLSRKKRQHLSGLMQQLFTGRRRLRGFAKQAWESVRIGDVVRESSQRNRRQFGIDRVMAVNKVHGLIPMRERTIAADIDRYKIVEPGAFAYNPMRINIGSIARSHLDGAALVSPDYVVFECTKCDPRYLDFLRQSEVWRRHMLIAGNGSVRVRIYFEDLARLRFRMPGPKEQQAIADVLQTAQREIDLLKQLREQIRRQKRGLMQKLLTGQIRVKEAAHG